MNGSDPVRVRRKVSSSKAEQRRDFSPHRARCGDPNI